jgi:hypothetical protein
MSLAAEYCLGLGEASGKEKECQMDGKMVKCSKLFTRVRHCMSLTWRDAGALLIKTLQVGDWGP